MSEHHPPPGWQSPPPGSGGPADEPAPEATAPLQAQQRPYDPYAAHRRQRRPDEPVPGQTAASASFGPTAYVGAAHKPGAIPLRPLTLGDMYDAAFKIIRFNPRATVGSAVLVASVAMAIPVLVTAALGSVLDLSMTGTLAGSSSADTAATATSEDVAGFLGVFGALGVGAMLQSVGLILVAGMIAHVVAAAVMGRKMSLGEAWAATRGKRWRLIGLTLLLGLATFMILMVYALSWIPVAMASDSWQLPVLYALVSIPAFLAFLVWFWVRLYYLPVPVLMLEEVGVFGALGRGYHLTGRAFWRTFGIALLTFVIAQIAGSMLAAPVSIVSQGLLLGGLPGEAGTYLLVIGQALASVITAAFVAPFTTTVATLQYVDLRMRREAFDVELMQRAGITQS
ncbi:MAG: hypothetical protein JWN68_1199 [Nocardioides sp.]|uniref:hypothetical protein n=1 Tax=Nocardioides sp. TaxID=35761 RepID=UPI0026019BEF|nr:hypothetical protein [Nocardioides sp.]MCW2833246.1 hypothetical protein [Nocardioides sp.]